ncbi:hypothetical protein CEXT_563591 [Caerostris extrusa]|uniref:Uncharacterized protein n=1 Tax=Caerostris extrusa TaxID=172846 RepID=A0AAV4R1F2_CAEEX|nr:hypothetical protein CEXT_563591 [Caerostris extrusa]
MVGTFESFLSRCKTFTPAAAFASSVQRTIIGTTNSLSTSHGQKSGLELPPSPPPFFWVLYCVVSESEFRLPMVDKRVRTLI